MIVPRVVNNIATDTTKVGANVLMTEQTVKCSSCGAVYTIETYLDSRPTVSDQMLMRLDNRIHP